MAAGTQVGQFQIEAQRRAQSSRVPVRLQGFRAHSPVQRRFDLTLPLPLLWILPAGFSNISISQYGQGSRPSSLPKFCITLRFPSSTLDFFRPRIRRSRPSSSSSYGHKAPRQHLGEWQRGALPPRARSPASSPSWSLKAASNSADVFYQSWTCSCARLLPVLQVPGPTCGNGRSRSSGPPASSSSGPGCQRSVRQPSPAARLSAAAAMDARLPGRTWVSGSALPYHLARAAQRPLHAGPWKRSVTARRPSTSLGHARAPISCLSCRFQGQPVQVVAQDLQAGVPLAPFQGLPAPAMTLVTVPNMPGAAMVAQFAGGPW